MRGQSALDTEMLFLLRKEKRQNEMGPYVGKDATKHSRHAARYMGNRLIRPQAEPGQPGRRRQPRCL
jgi:hypothetical protein